MYLVTVATNPYQYESMMLGLLSKKLNYTFKVAGIDWKWEGWRTKMKAYAEALSEISEKDPDALCICSDSYDTLPVRDADEFSKLFYEFETDIVTSAENNCGGNCRPLQSYNVHNATFKYVNAGLLGGKAFALKNMWTYFYEHGYKDDQLALSEYVDNSFNSIKVDTEAKLFFNSAIAFGYDKKSFLTENIIYGKEAFVVHFPGLNFFASQKINYKKTLETLLKIHKLEHILNTRESRAGNYLFYLAFLLTLIWALVASYYCLKRNH